MAARSHCVVVAHCLPPHLKVVGKVFFLLAVNVAVQHSMKISTPSATHASRHKVQGLLRQNSLRCARTRNNQVVVGTDNLITMDCILLTTATYLRLTAPSA